ncbi:hypothetical protein DV737_g1871, partial [Chaetothyriales sp. CBS 132003]
MAPPVKKRRRTDSAAVEEIVFSPTARQEYLTGFHKRKVQRTKAAQEVTKRKEREERIRQRKRIREERKQELEAHVRQVNAAIQPELEGDGGDDESEDGEEDTDEGGSAVEDGDGDGAAVVEPVDHEAEYVDEDKYTSVVVEEMDVSREGLRKTHDDAKEQSQGRPQDKPRQNGTGVASKPAPTHGKARDGALKAKKKRKKFRYENKAERKATREKERSKNRQQAKARRAK